MKILHTSDLHLKDYGDERWKTLEKLIEIGKKEKIEIFIVSGDLFDKNIDADNLRDKIRGILSNNDFKVILIPGNHDEKAYGNGAFFGEDVFVLTDLNEPFEYKDVVIRGIPFQPIEGQRVLEELYSVADDLSKDKTNILLYHGELTDAVFQKDDFGEEGEERYMPVKLSYFEDLNFQYILAGHFHSRFGVWNLNNGGYFVYPGSPISITKKETGKRKVNLFEVGKAPKEYEIDSPYYENIFITLDPFSNDSPLKLIKRRFDGIDDDAKVILIITGYINGHKIGMTETEFVNEIKNIVKGKTLEEHLEFKDINMILDNDLFKKFDFYLNNSEDNEERKKRLRDLAVKAMMGAKL
jgi:DNA repair exonuclease SbcCD nuclease subunit